MLLICFLSTSLILGCGGEREVFEPELARYLSNPENGLVKTHKYDQVNWRIELMSSSDQSKRAGTNEAETSAKSLHFILTVSSGGAFKNSDVMMTGVGSYEEYADRMILLNFRMSEMIQLRIGERVVSPVISNMENTFGLTEDRKIHIVFADDSFPEQLSEFPEMDFVLNDQVFETGTSHFVFLKDELNRIPLLKH